MRKQQHDSSGLSWKYLWKFEGITNIVYGIAKNNLNVKLLALKIKLIRKILFGVDLSAESLSGSCRNSSV